MTLHPTHDPGFSAKRSPRGAQVMVVILAAILVFLALPAQRAEASVQNAQGVCNTDRHTVEITGRISAPANSHVYTMVLLQHFDRFGNNTVDDWYPPRYEGKTTSWPLSWTVPYHRVPVVNHDSLFGSFSIVRPWLVTATSTDGVNWSYQYSLLAYEVQHGTKTVSPVPWTCLA